MCEAGRAIAASEGITVIRREGDLVAYIGEDAIRPLWRGKRFAIEACISGRAMLDNKPILIADVFADPRVPHIAYRPTFMRSMAMYPIGLTMPTMAIGAYWSEPGLICPGASAVLANLAHLSGVTLARLSAQGSSLH